MLLLLLNQPGSGGPILARAPAGSGYTRATLQITRPGTHATARPAQPNTKR